MDKASFSLLPINDKLIILKTEARLLTQIRNLSNIVTLYAYEGYLIEEYRDKESKELVKIEPLTKYNEAERLNLYSMYITGNNIENITGIAFKTEAEKNKPTIIVCSNCDYEMSLDGAKTSVEAMPNSCPICEKTVFKFR